MKMAQRLNGLELSAIRRFSEGAPEDAIPLAIGQPTWDLPEAGREALRNFSGVCEYGPGAGRNDLREALASLYQAPFDEVMISSGSEGALFSLLQAFVDPGDAVLIPDPGFVTYRNLVLYCGGVPRMYPLTSENGFQLDQHSVLKTLDETNAKAVIINHPANPTGAGMAAEDLSMIADECLRRDVLLISDEVYRELYLNERPPGLRDVTRSGVVVSSVSKAWGGAGLRVGWAIGNPRWLDPARLVHAYSVTSSATTSQMAATALIRASESIHIAARKELKARWEALSTALSEYLNHEASPPAGAFYYWLPLPETAHTDPIAFCTQIRDQARVLLVPGIVFGEGGRGFVRVSYAATPDQITEGARRLGASWGG
ncbi:MAG TPA: pyridoxal phosphate-dependent aminotransferase [candidate division Zixibacteria bacterium]|nr:pyridoxal phosphate-dependent aminotransferase [candidate division Zixibacteria bacterium]